MGEAVNISWPDVFGLPEIAKVEGRRLPKTVLMQQAELNKSDQKKLGRIARIEHFGTVARSTTKTLPVSNDDYEIQMVLFLHVDVKSGGPTAEIAELLHKSFPNPTVIVQEGLNEAMLSVSVVRKSKAEHGAFVLEDWKRAVVCLPPKDIDWQFLDSLNFKVMCQDDLLSFVQDMLVNIECARAANIIGFYPIVNASNKTQRLELVRQLNDIASKLNEYKNARKAKDVSLNDSAKLRVKMRECEEKITSLKMQLEGL